MVYNFIPPRPIHSDFGGGEDYWAYHSSENSSLLIQNIWKL